MRKKLGVAMVAVYATGYWVYGVMYVWNHWAGFGLWWSLAYYAFTRALIWPVWLLLELL